MSSGSRSQASPSGGPVVRCGHLRKMKTLKKKYFVLRGDSPGHSACLEYYDSKKKFDNRQPPKRSITMRSCFNINRRSDTKHANVIALYTKDECFSLILDSEKELDDWLTAMLLLSGDVPDGEQPRPTFEHVWQVNMQKKGLGERKNIYGPYRLCLTDRTLSLVKVGGDNIEPIEFSLVCIRRCGYMERIFYMEVGRSAVTGGGDFWMEAEDHNIAYNMHAAILNAMSSSSRENSSVTSGLSSSSGTTGSFMNRDDVGPRQRVRSSSANEASKPISVLQRRHTGAKLHGFSPLEEQRSIKEHVDPLREQNVTASAPSQCSQSQSTSSSNTLTAVAGTGSIGSNVIVNNANIISNIINSNCTCSSSATANRRRHSVASHPHNANNSYTVNATTMTMTTTTSTTTASTSPTTTPIQQQQQQQQSSTTATKSHQRTLSLPLAANVVNQSQSSKRSVLRCATGRDRCDSLPSRARTTSEGHPTAVVLGHPRGGHLAPHINRPHSMYGRGLSYSPPVSSIPISPASGACSTDSAGSSLSMDDGAENILEESTTLSRYGHSLTPDEPAILEENLDDYASWSSSHQPHKYSPNFKSHSPSQQSSYVEMYSPCGSSPGRSGSISAAYMPMSPATGASLSMLQHHQPMQHNHSRASSLVEEATLPDGYVPMAPVGDDGYVDMDPSNASQHNGHFSDDISQHGSSCSVTSGTPSTDLRFSEYHLDKVTSYLAPGDETPSARPIRAYSVGSRPEQTTRHRKNRLEIAQQESSRVRAFSVGSRSKRPEIIGRLASVIASRLPSGKSDDSTTNSNKSNSAPLLSSSWGHNSGCSANSERMEDLMELDFTKPIVPHDSLNSPSSFSYSQSQSYSTATDTSSYVDMSPGQAHTSGNSTTAPYVDMSGINKINRTNNNNTTTANHNHNHVQPTSLVSSMSHKLGIKTLKPVEEAEGAYMRMENSLEDWPRTGNSPKQAASPMQDDYMQMNGPPGVTRTAPVDLPQPRRPPEGYVEMSFKSRPSLEQDYINMTMGTSGGSGGSIQSAGSRTRNRRTREASRNDKSQRSQPIAIQASTKTTKTPSFLPLNGSPISSSLASTPASPPRATPTGSTATIFPFSLNSPQSPIKPFTGKNEKSSDDNGKIMADQSSLAGDYAIMAPGVAPSSSVEISKSGNNGQDVPQSPLTKRLAELTLTRTKSARNSNNTSGISSKNDDDDNNTNTGTKINEKINDKTANTAEAQSSRSMANQENDISQSPASKRRGSDIPFAKIKSSRASFTKDDSGAATVAVGGATVAASGATVAASGAATVAAAAATTSTINESGNANLTINTKQEMPTSPVTKRLGDLSVVKAKLVHPSPNTSPTPSAGFKIIQKTQSTGKIGSDDASAASPTPTPTPSATPTANPSNLDSEGYEKLQPGATILHYASLDLPEVGNAPPVSPTPAIEGFKYAEIDFAKLKQN